MSNEGRFGKVFNTQLISISDKPWVGGGGGYITHKLWIGVQSKHGTIETQFEQKGVRAIEVKVRSNLRRDNKNSLRHSNEPLKFH